MLDARRESGAGPDRAWREPVDLRNVPPPQRSTASIDPRNARAMSLSSASAAAVVYVVDPEATAREALQVLIEGAGWTVEAFACAQAFLARPRVGAPSCLLLDVSLSGSSGLDVQKRAAIDRSDMPIIFTTSAADVPLTVRAMKAGALEFFLKPLSDEVVLRAVDCGIAFSRAARCRQAETTALRSRHATLTRREREVMSLVVAGRLNKQVAGALGISEITVKAHRGSVMRKMHADSFATLVGIAIKLGLAAA